MFSISGSMLFEIDFMQGRPKTANRRQPCFKRENLSWLIRLSVSDGQKIDSSKDV